MNTDEIIEAQRVNAPFAVSDLDHAAWHDAPEVHLRRYWSGKAARPGRHAEARLLWSNEALMVRFVCRQAEMLIVNDAPQLNDKTLGLWDRDVCELFVAPDTCAPEKYFEFEAAPTGEWVDLALQRTASGRETDWQYRSGMSAAARINEGFVTIAMSVPWSAFGCENAPAAETLWRANLFRCVGAGSSRGYLAWRPTYTPQPSFHVPEAFGWLCFKVSK
jgi:hypothetical protein